MVIFDSEPWLPVFIKPVMNNSQFYFWKSQVEIVRFDHDFCNIFSFFFQFHSSLIGKTGQENQNSFNHLPGEVLSLLD